VANRVTLGGRLRRAHVGRHFYAGIFGRHFRPAFLAGSFGAGIFGQHFWPAFFGQHVLASIFANAGPSGGQGPRGAHEKIGERFALQKLLNTENMKQ
jgi:hypothetical protein